MLKKSKIKLIGKLTPETKAVLLDETGKPITEEMTLLTNMPKFKLVPIFDVSQTDGDSFPELFENLTGNAERYGAFLNSLKTVTLEFVVF